MSKALPPTLSPLPAELLKQLGPLSAMQLAWLSGYCWSRCELHAADGFAPARHLSEADVAPATTQTLPAARPRRITILSASQTGNARRMAERLHTRLADTGIEARLTGAADFKSRSLPDEDIVLLVTSTQGEGEPPEEAIALHKYLFGKKAPDLSHLSFAVLGLGDSSYPKFCQAAKDFDAQLARLGATRLAERGDCDLDYQSAAEAWIEQVVPGIEALVARSANGAPVDASTQHASDTVANHAATDPAAGSSARYTRDNPFHATLSTRQKITARTAGKDVEHLEIDLSGSGIHYQPGDALGVWPMNSPALVDEILTRHGLAGSESVQLPDGWHGDLRTALTSRLDITQSTPALIRAYAALGDDEALKQRLADPATTALYLAQTPPVGLFADHPHALAADQLVSLFRPLEPRLYSIASAQAEVGDEVHLTVGLLSFEHHGQTYQGAASGFLCQRLEEGDTLRVFVQPNPHFRLPDDGDTPVIMIGAGTGIAPFRAFLQQREAREDRGRNWLFFGNQRFIDDFLYQAEWLQYRKNGLLTRGDFAWSRQGAHKTYVQHRLREAGADVWAWLQDGAHLYVCGDATRMARDVEQALIDIIAGHGHLTADDAADYLAQLREDRRYQRDVY